MASVIFLCRFVLGFGVLGLRLVIHVIRRLGETIAFKVCFGFVSGN